MTDAMQERVEIAVPHLGVFDLDSGVWRSEFEGYRISPELHHALDEISRLTALLAEREARIGELEGIAQIANDHGITPADAEVLVDDSLAARLIAQELEREILEWAHRSTRPRTGDAI